MLSSASDAQVIVLEDDEEQTVSGRRSGKVPVLLNDEHTFEVERDAISDDALGKLTLEDIVRKLTGLPDSIGFASFAVCERSNVTEKIEIRSLEGLRQAMASYHSPLFLLCTVPHPPKATNQRRSTINHPMILLEPYVSELNPQVAGNARTYFECLHLNSQLSHKALDELRKLFLPLKRHNAELWNRGMTPQKICDDSREDISKILQLDAFVARLNERDAAVARLDLDIVRKGNPLARNAVRELDDRFSPTGRVNAGHWDKTLRLKECFDTISAWDG